MHATNEMATAKPGWEAYREEVHHPDYAAAMAILELSPAVAGNAAHWLTWREHHTRPDGSTAATVRLDWEGWVQDVDEAGRGWSSNEWRLFAVAASVAVGRPTPIAGVLDCLSEWKLPVWQILTSWASGSNAERILNR